MSPTSRRLRSPEPPPSVRIAWAVAYWVGVGLGVFGLWLVLVADQPVRGAALLAVCLGALAMFVSLKTWWSMQVLAESQTALADAIAQAAGGIARNTVSSGPGFAAERPAPRSEGHAPGGGDPEGRSEPLRPSNEGESR